MKYEVLMSAPKVLRDFLTYNSTIKNKSSKSVNEYYLDLTTFFRYLKLNNGLVNPETEFSDIDISDVGLDLLKTVTLQDLHAFLVYCKEERGNTASTRARKCSTLRIFFKYLTSYTKQLDVNPAELLETPKMKKSLPRHLTLDDSISLLNAVDGPNRERDYCILTLFLNCGMRLSELCGINLTDIRTDGSLRLLGKGNKERVIYLNQSCINAIEAYLRVRPREGVPADQAKALFLSRNHRRISNKTVQALVQKYLSKADLDGMGFSTHKLRHTAATLMYQQGHVDIRVLKEILGHENLGTTQIYTHVADSQIEEAINSNPLSEVKPPKYNDNNKNTGD